MIDILILVNKQIEGYQYDNDEYTDKLKNWVFFRKWWLVLKINNVISLFVNYCF